MSNPFFNNLNNQSSLFSNVPLAKYYHPYFLTHFYSQPQASQQQPPGSYIGQQMYQNNGMAQQQVPSAAINTNQQGAWQLQDQIKQLISLYGSQQFVFSQTFKVSIDNRMSTIVKEILEDKRILTSIDDLSRSSQNQADTIQQLDTRMSQKMREIEVKLDEFKAEINYKVSEIQTNHQQLGEDF